MSSAAELLKAEQKRFAVEFTLDAGPKESGGDENPFWNDSEATTPQHAAVSEAGTPTPNNSDISTRIQTLLQHLVKSGSNQIYQSQLDGILNSGQPGQPPQALMHGRTYLLEVTTAATHAATHMLGRLADFDGC